MNLLQRLRRAFRGEPSDNTADLAIRDAEASLHEAQERNKEVRTLATAVRVQGDKNHFVERLHMKRAH